MSRSERFTEPKEIKRFFKKADDSALTTGPIIYSENGVNYYDDSENHIVVDGRPGTGKTACVSTSYLLQVIRNKEDCIVADPKGDMYNNTAHIAKKTHNVMCLDFRNPSKSLHGWNPLKSIYDLYKSGDICKEDIASNQLGDIADGIYKGEPTDDAFWQNSAADFFLGLVYALFELDEEEAINLGSISEMMRASEKKTGGRLLISALCEYLPENSLAAKYLEPYISAPIETRGSTHYIATNGLNIVNRSKGLTQMLSRDDIRINDLDSDGKPLLIYCIIPDETDMYDPLAAIFISQVTQHFTRLAQNKYSGRLPRRLNIILEELSSIGKSLPNLPKLMSAARSRNIRLMLVLQNGPSQLKDIYGESKAKAIDSCVGITFAFSTNSWESLKEWSQRCGEKEIELNGSIIKEPLITPAQIAAMPVGTALVMIASRFKYIAKLPFYNEVFDTSVQMPDETKICNCTIEPHIFDMKNYVEEKRRKRVEQLLSAACEPQEAQNDINEKSPERLPDIDIGALTARIDAKLQELEDNEQKNKSAGKKFSVTVFDTGSMSKDDFADLLHISAVEAQLKFNSLPVRIMVNAMDEALKIAQRIKDCDGKAIIFPTE